ncbi:MAG: hypothetical protein ACR65O_06610 [Methylomicrobium sp.]
MSKTKPSPSMRRAAEAPPLPAGTIPFILYCLSSFKAWITLMIVFETGQAAGSILVPYVRSRRSWRAFPADSPMPAPPSRHYKARCCFWPG